MVFIEILFWICLFLLFYCYAGYGLLLFLINSVFSRKSQPKQETDEMPEVTFIVAVYNEEEVLHQKIQNTLGLDYPAGKLQMIFITDGSVDGSTGIVAQYSDIKLLHARERLGKSAAIKRAMRFVQTPIVVFSDANTFLNKGCIKHIVRHYNDKTIGGVAGEKKISNSDRSSAVGAAEGLYWKYESFMKKQDADLNTVVGAAGELFSIRTALFQDFEDDIILDDFVISMQICLKGYRIGYEPRAFAIEAPSTTLLEEEKRKVRISAGAYQSIGYLKEGLNIFKYPLLSFQYISRRLLRWIICPPMLLLLFLSDIFLVFNDPDVSYRYFLWAQVIFYLLAFWGWVFYRYKLKLDVCNLPFYFVFMNICLVKGFFTFIKGKQTVLWEKSMREAIE